MCFYNDCDWSAEVYEENYTTLGGEAKCKECFRLIQDGEWRQYVYQQECEVCLICEDECSDDFREDADPETCAHDYGQTFSADICRECCLILESIWDLETIEGCPEHAKQPAYGELAEALFEGASYEDDKYRRHALERYPGLIASTMMIHTQPRGVTL